MKQVILVAGATGNLGRRIVKALLEKGAEVKAVVRAESDAKKVAQLTGMGAQVITVDWSDAAQLTKACKGAACVVSSLAGLRDVIVEDQSRLLDAAVAAGVPRFIPSDFASDFTDLPKGENRNFDLRKEFHEYLDKTAIQSTSIFNGAFTDILRYNTPLFNVKDKTIAYWGDKADWKIDFTTMDETAAYTAAAALDEKAPKALRIASFQVSPEDLVDIADKVKQEKYILKQMGSLGDLSAYNKRERAAHPEGETQLYSSWQQSQYLYSMFVVHNDVLDNNRYPNLTWTKAEDFIGTM